MSKARDLASIPAGSGDFNVDGDVGVTGTTTLTNSTGGSGVAAELIFGTAGNTENCKIEGTTPGTTTGIMKFYTDTAGTLTEKMRIDSDGYLLVGKTTSDDTNAGMRTNGNFMSVTRDGGRPVYLNRLTDNGPILDFAKDSTTVGSITISSSALTIGTDNGSSDTGIMLGNSSVTARAVIPCRSEGSIISDAISLGYASGRFKDLYLSGGVYLGGTGSANYLDDYEEGTWTPQVLAGNNGTDVVVSNASNRGNYIKIGTLVYLEWRVNTSTASTSNLHVEGLPFTSVSTNAQGGVGIEHGNTQHSFFFLDGGALRGYDSDTGSVTPVNQASGVYRGSVIYRTS